MLFTKTPALLLALAAARSAVAHTVFTHFYVNGVSQGVGVAMRMNKTPAKASFPVENLASSDMACGFDGTEGVSRVQSVKDGSTLTFEFHSWPNDFSKQSLDPGHKGPCAVYLKKVNSAVEDPGTGDGWFKIFDDGYDSAKDEWCTDRLIANNGRLSVKLPDNLKGGDYLARPEILALHAAVSGDPQFYTGCAQIFLESKGTLVPESTVSIPGYVKAGEESVSFNIYYNPTNKPYPVPGPKVAKLKAGPSTGAIETTQKDGVKPAGCIMENANWCGFEVPSYTDEKGCWASAQDCWNQGDKCYKPYPPTGAAGCDLWEKKCQAIDDACKNKQFTGPPNKGKDLTPPQTSIVIGLVMPTEGAAQGGADSPTPSSAVEVAASSAGSPSTFAVITSAPVYSKPVTFISKSKTASTSKEAVEAPAPTYNPYLATVTETVVKTEVEYVTLYSKQRRDSHARRHVAGLDRSS
ncbi:uncharacterized protein BDZ99DRAFT_566044 [Mytilinidion resinicola]|uniref:AA9 family lytic polysaccharide monooxygenase n=1 Tax=Mytilinidion resinicola TaxID=574789 RepID=A0A6A6Z7H5_9PEZI|nr:uncharacterized protein BDZ99DRAFT_566044 [Mytilinidion resinicola]KAF2816187.1 hypothetical protein BDZ99DRAFT_566044 [Mytilinidion resinicola]